MEEMDEGAVTLVVDLARTFGKVQLKVAWAWATRNGFPWRILRVLCGHFQHHLRRVIFEGCATNPLLTTAAILPGSKWSCLHLRIVLQDSLTEVRK